MVNKDIARQFSLLAGLMELHGENAFKTKAYSNAYLALRKWDQPLADMAQADIEKIPGIGSSVAAKIRELLDTGTMDALEKYKAKTPEGIQQLLSVKGLGPKKIKAIWDGLEIETPTELLYACQENRLVSLSGFGLKSQEDLRQKIEYFLESRKKYLYGHLDADMPVIQSRLEKAFPKHRFSWVGEVARKCPVIDRIEMVVAPPLREDDFNGKEGIFFQQEVEGGVLVEVEERFDVYLFGVEDDRWMEELVQRTVSGGILEKAEAEAKAKAEAKAEAEAEAKAHLNKYPSIEDVLNAWGYVELAIEMTDFPGIEAADPELWRDLITDSDIKGIIHNHSTWSDGIHSLEDMAKCVRDAGYEYFAICDHSRSAFYANGLSAERVLQQMEEIDQLNQKLAPFKIFKGIESDILGDGSLDYEEEILKKFDLIVASVHSNLKMDEEKAMSRLIRAIENPYTRILGHPTGRLLLSRQGYPVDHKKLIDACAANDVVIELNANPLRLDIDYTWLPYCMEKGVLVSINPDAHAKGQVDLVKYGVIAARKGGLKRTACLNAISLQEFSNWIMKKK